MGNEEKEFKVTDKRSSSGQKDDEIPKEAAGEGFTMKEGAPVKPTAPHQIDFSTFILSLATGALIQLGLAPDPMTKKVRKNTELAKQNIDLLGLLKEKTKGNLTPDEDKLMESLLTEVRLKYVETTR